MLPQILNRLKSWVHCRVVGVLVSANGNFPSYGDISFDCWTPALQPFKKNCYVRQSRKTTYPFPPKPRKFAPTPTDTAI
jgi:hypothetical protein